MTQIHSDETRSMVSRMIIECRSQDGQIDEWGERELRDDFLELLAKEQTRLLDRVLDAVEKKKRKLIEPVTKREVREKDKAVIDLDADTQGSLVFIQDNGFDTALTEVTSTIQRLKEEM